MAKRKGSGAHKNRNTSTILAAQAFEKIASEFLDSIFGAGESKLWKTDLVESNAWVAVPVDQSTYVLKSTETGIGYEMSSHAAGIVCSFTAWTALIHLGRGTKNEADFRNAQLAVISQMEAHPESASMLAVWGQS